MPNTTLTAAMTDQEAQRAVLALLLREGTMRMTFPALAEELLEDACDVLAGDALARAVRDLVVDGLLESNGVFVSPTRAALQFKRLCA